MLLWALVSSPMSIVSSCFRLTVRMTAFSEVTLKPSMAAEISRDPITCTHWAVERSACIAEPLCTSSWPAEPTADPERGCRAALCAATAQALSNEIARLAHQLVRYLLSQDEESGQHRLSSRTRS